MSDELPKVDIIREKLRLFQPDNDWVNLFSYYDLDGDCRMGQDEFGLLLRRDIGLRVHQISDEEIEEVFQQIDIKQSGDVDPEEFAAWVVQETVESQWVKVRAALRSTGDKGLSKLVANKALGDAANIASESTVDAGSSPANFDDEISVRARRGAGVAMPAWKANLRAALKSTWFRYVVVTTILSNTLVLALDHHGISADDDSFLRTSHSWLTLLFACEMWLRMLAFDWDEFFGKTGARPDLVMLIVGLLDLATYNFMQWIVAGAEGNSSLPPGLDINNYFIVYNLMICSQISMILTRYSYFIYKNILTVGISSV